MAQSCLMWFVVKVGPKNGEQPPKKTEATVIWNLDIVGADAKGVVSVNVRESTDEAVGDPSNFNKEVTVHRFKRKFKDGAEVATELKTDPALVTWLSDALAFSVHAIEVGAPLNNNIFCQVAL